MYHHHLPLMPHAERIVDVLVVEEHPVAAEERRGEAQEHLRLLQRLHSNGNKYVGLCLERRRQGYDYNTHGTEL